MPNRDDVVNTARTWIGVPWLHQGRTRNGIDCVGLIVVVAKELGLSDYDSNNYQRRTHGLAFLRHFRDRMKEKPVSEAAPGDVLLFRDSAYPCHSSIVGFDRDRLTIIHAYALRKRVVEEPLNQGKWTDKMVACFEFEGMNTWQS